MNLQWREIGNEGFVGYSFNVDIALAVKRHDGVFVWKIDGVHMKWTAKGYGEVKTMAAAKRAAERAWSKWLVAAGLQVKP